MKRFNTLYVGLMSLLMVFGAKGMEPNPNAWMHESKIWSDKEIPTNPFLDPLGQSSLDQSSFMQSQAPASTKPLIISTKEQSLPPLENLRILSKKLLNLDPSSSNQAKLLSFETGQTIHNILKKDVGSIINRLPDNELFIDSINHILNPNISITKEIIIPFKAGLDTIYYQSHPRTICPDLLKNFSLIYDKSTKLLDNDIFNETKNILTILTTTNQNEKEKQKVLSYVQKRLDSLPQHEQNSNKITLIICAVTSLIQVLCGENIAGIADVVKNNKELPISARIIILKALQKLPKALINENNIKYISDKIKALENQKILSKLHKKLWKLRKELTQPEATNNLKNLIEYKNTLEQYINLTPAGFADREMQEALENVSERIEILKKNSSAVTAQKSDTSLLSELPSNIEDEFPLVSLEGLEAIPQIPNQSEPSSIPTSVETPSVIKIVNLLPYPFSNEQSLIASSFDMINRAIIMDEIEGKKLLKEAIDIFRKAIKQFTLFNRDQKSEDIANEYFAKPDVLKKEMQNVYKNIFPAYVCHSIPFFLSQLSQYQFLQDDDSKKLFKATEADLLNFIEEQARINQLLNQSTGLRAEIISKGLNHETMQAYLLLLNAACRFYPDLAPEIKLLKQKNTQTKTKPLFDTIISDIINDIAFAYKQKPTNSADSDQFFKTTIQKLNALTLVGPLLLGTLKVPSISNDQLETYMKATQLVEKNIKDDLAKKKSDIILKNISSKIDISSTIQPKQTKEIPEVIVQSNEPIKPEAPMARQIPTPIIKQLSIAPVTPELEEKIQANPKPERSENILSNLLSEVSTKIKEGTITDEDRIQLEKAYTDYTSNISITFPNVPNPLLARTNLLRDYKNTLERVNTVLAEKKATTTPAAAPKKSIAQTTLATVEPIAPPIAPVIVTPVPVQTPKLELIPQQSKQNADEASKIEKNLELLKNRDFKISKVTLEELSNTIETLISYILPVNQKQPPLGDIQSSIYQEILIILNKYITELESKKLNVNETIDLRHFISLAEKRSQLMRLIERNLYNEANKKLINKMIESYNNKINNDTNVLIEKIKKDPSISQHIPLYFASHSQPGMVLFNAKEKVLQAIANLAQQPAIVPSVQPNWLNRTASSAWSGIVSAWNNFWNYLGYTP